MAKPKTLYSLQGIFSKLLSDTDTTGFVIPTYQRGYKWTSFEDKGQVDILLKDLYNAFQSKNPRYYLQFLTLKENNSELEVIDGQQRLTTLTILCSVMVFMLGTNADHHKNFVIGKLKYQTRQNFIEKFIYSNIAQLIDSEDWTSFKSQNVEHDNQDIYFIYHAAKAMHKFIQRNLHDRSQLFFDYLSESIFLIVNILDPGLNSEKIFINVNKGVKLSDEDLLKGLLITKIPIDVLSGKYRVTDTEINEFRNNLGRQWDDISNWASRQDIRSYFKVEDEESRLEWLIRLSFPGIVFQKDAHYVFKYFDSLYQQKKITAVEIFERIRNSKMILNDWFSEPELSNLLGFVLHAHKSHKRDKVWADLFSNTVKSAVIAALKRLVKNLLPWNETGVALKDLTYDKHKDELFNVFLILDILKFLPIGGREAKLYDFSKIAEGTWSIEHIFPQNAKEFANIEELSEEDLSIIKQIIPENEAELRLPEGESKYSITFLFKKIRAAESSCIIRSDERQYLESLLSYNAPILHGIGNLALLQKNMNSSLSNHFFDRKRRVLVGKISAGAFVPFHTYDVFSKLLISEETGLHVWSKSDIGKHQKYINDKMIEISKYLNE